jgi:large repetitive protein
MHRQRNPQRRRQRALGTAIGAVLAVAATGLLVTASRGEAALSRGLAAPTNTAAPTITGAAETGQTLTGSTGSWSGTVSAYHYQWTTCDTGGGSCANIAGATSSTYVIASSDAGYTIRLYVSASNGSEYSTAGSTPTQVVLSGPKNTSLPGINGIAAVGQTLTATTGSWDTRTTTSYSYQWGRCDSNGANCTNISGAGSSNYVPTSGDVGHQLVVYVTAHDAAGFTTAQSPKTPSVASSAAVPRNTKAPTISGTLAVGQTLTANVGTWSSSLPITYSYQWASCDSGGGHCTNISDATRSTFLVPAEVIGHRLVVYVSGNNQAGYTTAQSALTAVVPGGPLNTKAPTVSGRTQVGSKLTANVGDWSSQSTISSFAFQWVRCDSSGNRCANISRANSSSYTIQAGDSGSRLYVAVTAKNSTGSTTANSALTGVVSGNSSVIGVGNGKQSIAATSVTLPARLVIDKLQFQPKRIHGRSPFLARFHVSDTRGYSVRGALLYVLGLPYSWVQKGIEVSTDTTGWATVTITPSRKLPTGRGHAIVMFVRARVPGQPILAGSSSRRLVQITTAGK